jgi:hypothetical protein
MDYFTFYQVLFDVQIMYDEKGGAWKMRNKLWSEKFKGRDELDEADMNRVIILKNNLKTRREGVALEFIWVSLLVRMNILTCLRVPRV